jgi:hypothetical protein
MTPVALRDWAAWLGFGVSILALAVVAWACLTSWGAIVHGHPAYAILLGVTALLGLLGLWRTARPRARRRGWRVAGRVALILLGALGIATVAWLRPYTAIEPALAAMESDSSVLVTESVTSIVLSPHGPYEPNAVLFQPGALVDPRAYAAVLRPLAEAGTTVVIVKQPLGIGFLALGALESARAAHPEVTGWIVAGHSLGGTVAAIQAEEGQAASAAPTVGLMFFASYPATDLSDSLTIPVASISGSRDALSTPADIEESKSNLPADATFTAIDGASHAQFGDYGPQRGDNEPTISNNEAREQISTAAVAFVASTQPQAE